MENLNAHFGDNADCQLIPNMFYRRNIVPRMFLDANGYDDSFYAREDITVGWVARRIYSYEATKMTDLFRHLVSIFNFSLTVDNGFSKKALFSFAFLPYV